MSYHVLLQLWTESNIWDFPYASMDQFVLVQRWLSQLPVEVRVWAKKGKDWRSLLDEVCCFDLHARSVFT